MIEDILKAKPLFVERIKKQIGDEDAENFFNSIKKKTRKSIRINTIKASPEEIKTRLKQKGWKIREIKNFPLAVVIESELKPGELGKTLEHSLGYYYVQEVTSMLPALALNPKEGESILDICAAPGSKTTQISAMMNNKGIVFANDIRSDRTRVLNFNLNKCGVSNAIITSMDGFQLLKIFENNNFLFDKITLDAPCSGEGTIMNDLDSLKMWNIRNIEKLSKIQKQMASRAFNSLKVGGTLVYSTCTLAPEEDEEVIQYLLDNFPCKIEKVNFPLKFRKPLKEWDGRKFSKEIQKCAKFWPQDNESEGFFIAKIIKIKNKEKGEKIKCI